MTLEKKLLQKVPEWRPTPHERAALTIAADDTPWTVRLTADRCEELGAALWELRLERLSAPLALTHDQLEAWAKAVAQIPGLMEPLAVVEIDKPHGRAQLRSATPTERDGRATYFEILLSRSGQVDVRRYQTGDAERQQIVFVMTHENLARVAVQLTECVPANESLA
jgi:hypothetical protein